MEAVLAHSSPPPTCSFVARITSKGCSEIIDRSHSSTFLSGISLRHHLLRVPAQCQQSRGPSLVRAGKGKRRYVPGMPQSRPGPSFPKFDDDDNPKFVIFARDKKVPLWFPLSIVSGGTTAKMMVAARGIELGKKMSESALTRNIGAAVYQDEKSIRVTLSKKYPILKTATDIEYGYKIVEKDNPTSALTTSNVIKIPPKEELKSVVDKLRDFFGQGVSGLKNSFGSITSLDYGTEEEAPASPGKDVKSK